MVIKKVKTVFKSVFHRENKDYFGAEIVGGAVSFTTATLANIVFNELGFPKGLNSVLTYITQCSAGLGTFVLTYRRIHREEDPRGLDTKKHAFLLTRTGSKASIFGGIAKFSLHYILLATNFVPSYLSAPIAYSIAGLGSSYYRHKKNYENGILSIKNNEEQKPASIDELVC